MYHNYCNYLTREIHEFCTILVALFFQHTVSGETYEGVNINYGFSIIII